MRTDLINRRNIVCTNILVKAFILLLFFISETISIKAQNISDIKLSPLPNTLIITAHPDDESGCAATIYALTKHLGAKADLCVITNGEAGYKYSLFAEDLYGLSLTKETVGRENLPSIRKRELMNGGKYIGIRNYYFLDQTDTYYTLDADSVLEKVWNVPMIQERLQEILAKERYELIVCLLPVPETHGHHKAATILALRAVRTWKKNHNIDQTPIVLGCTVTEKNDTARNTVFTGLQNYPETKVTDGKPFVSFDRTQKFGFNNRLDYKTIVNWLIAEHKSQGTMPAAMNRGDLEQFWFFDVNSPEKRQRVQEIFALLNSNLFQKSIQKK